MKVRARVVRSPRPAGQDAPGRTSASAGRTIEIISQDKQIASAPLGPSIRAEEATVDVPTGSAFFLGQSAEGLGKLAPEGRTSFEPIATEGAEVLVRWSDGVPLLWRKSMGRGAVFALSLPLSTDESDFVLRPAFLALLERFVGTARSRGGARLVDVARADGEQTVRIATVPEREIDMRPRKIAETARAETQGGVQPALDVSPYVALGLIGLFAAELLLRTWGQRREAAANS